MNFIQKLIQDTDNGDWDFMWKYNAGTYTLNKPKHYLSGLNFTTREKKKFIVFPNGSELTAKPAKMLEELKNSVRESLIRTMDISIRLYMNEKEMTPEEESTQAEEETNKNVEPKEKPIEKKKSV